MAASTLKKALTDKRDYRYITLENGIRAMLISDPQSIDPDVIDRGSSCSSLCSSYETDTAEPIDDLSDLEPSDREDEESRHKAKKKLGHLMSAAALCVGVGSFSDPLEVPGLAHLLEHVILMGNEKFPGENEFDEFLQKHGGYVNATTDPEETVFYFTVRKAKFKESLERFAAVFISPLLREESMNREIGAVDSEFMEAHEDDSERLEQLLCNLAKEGSPTKKFFWGNTATLKEHPREKGIDVNALLKEFYMKYYSANLMTLAVVSCDPLDEMEGWIRESFSTIANHEYEHLDFSKDMAPFQEEEIHRLYKIVPTKPGDVVCLKWCLPPLIHHYKVNPLSLIERLVGHEGEGSALSVLREKHYAHTLRAGNSYSGSEFNSNFCLFTVEIELSTLGHKNVFECVDIVFQHIKMLQEATLDQLERYYEESRIIEENSFNYKEKEEPCGYVCDVAQSLRLYPVEQVLTANVLLMDFNEDVIRSVLNRLAPQLAGIFWLSSQHSVQCDRREPWFDTQYHIEEIPEEWKCKWKEVLSSDNLHLPLSNPFIATDFLLKPPDRPPTQHPTVLKENEHYRLWYYKDSKFNTPKAWYCLHLMSPLAMHSPHNAVCLELLLSMMNREMAKMAYYAVDAGLSYTLKCSHGNRGLVLQVNGFSHKIRQLFDLLINRIADYDISNDTFETEKEHLAQEYTHILRKGEKFLKNLRLSILGCQWTVTAKIAAIRLLTMQSMQAFNQILRQHMFVEGLFQGNVTAYESIDCMDFMKGKLAYLSLPLEVYPEVRVAQLPSNSEVSMLFPVEDLDPSNHTPNTLLIVYHQFGPGTFLNSVFCDILMQTLEEEVFDRLRTKRQLGYSVGCRSHNTHGVLGFSFYVHTQADKFIPKEAVQQIRDVISESLDSLNKMTDNDFTAHVTSLNSAKREEDLSLQDEVERHFAEILSGDYVFDRLQREIETLQHVTKQDVCQWYEKHIFQGEHFRRLVLQSLGQSNEPPSEVLPVPNMESIEEDFDRFFEEIQIDKSYGTRLLDVLSLGNSVAKVRSLDIRGVTPALLFRRKLLLLPTCHINH